MCQRRLASRPHASVCRIHPYRKYHHQHIHYSNIWLSDLSISQISPPTYPFNMSFGSIHIADITTNISEYMSFGSINIVKIITTVFKYQSVCWIYPYRKYHHQQYSLFKYMTFGSVHIIDITKNIYEFRIYPYRKYRHQHYTHYSNIWLSDLSIS